MIRVVPGKRCAVKRFVLKGVGLMLFSLLTTLLLLGLAEVVLRFHYRDVYSTPDGKSFFYNRSIGKFIKEYNGYRLRDDGYPVQHDGRYRVVVQGDSFTYGGGVYPVEKIFTDILEKRLLQDSYPRGVMVANAGVCGHNFFNHVRYLNFIEDIHPDFVLYQWYVNDYDSFPDPARFNTPKLIANPALHSWLWQHSALYYLVQHRYVQFRNAAEKKPGYDDYMIERFQDPDSKFSQRAAKELNSLLDGYEERGIAYGIVLFPSFSNSFDNYRFGFLHDRVLAQCEQRGIPCLDLRDSYSGMDAKNLWANVFDAHPGAEAHSIAARAIYDYFGPGWLEKAKASAGLESAAAVKPAAKE